MASRSSVRLARRRNASASSVDAERAIDACACRRRRGSVADRRRKRTAARRVVASSGGSEGGGPREEAEEDAESIVGVRWDGANLRWVRDSRSKSGAKIVAEPLSGPSYTVWPVVHAALASSGLRSVDCEEAHGLQERGKALILDVRTKKAYDKGHPVGALSVPLFRPVKGDTKYDNLKRLVMAGFAMEATERNPDFVNQLLEMDVSKDRTLVVCCDIGGTLETLVRRPGRERVYADKDRAFGRESRSLKACYELQQAGFQDVLHLKDGYNMWLHLGYPVEI